jgi:hypothetical protein
VAGLVEEGRGGHEEVRPEGRARPAGPNGPKGGSIWVRFQVGFVQ